MATAQVQAAETQLQTRPAMDLDAIVENTMARSQAEAARADWMTARVYGPGMGLGLEIAAFVIALGRDFGLNPAQSLQAIHLIGGKPSLGAQYKSAFLRQAGYSWRPVKHDATECRYKFYFKGEPMLDAKDQPLELAFTMEQATRAGYVENARGKGEKDKPARGNYDTKPENMLFARMIANFNRWYAPEVLGASLPDPVELIDEVVEPRTRMGAATKAEALGARVAAIAAKSEEVTA